MKFGLTGFCAVFSLLYGETFALYYSNTERDNMSRSSSNSSLSSDVEEITYSTDTAREPERVHIPWSGDEEVYQEVLCVYSKELNTKDPKDLKWLKKGRIFPNLEQLKIIDNDLKIVSKKRPLKKLRVLEVSGPVGSIEKLTNTLSITPNLEELILINTNIYQKLAYIVGKSVTLNLVKKVTLQEEDFTKIPDPLLVLPNIEQITINGIVYDQTVIENERNSRCINAIDKEKLIQDVKEGHLDEVKQQVRTIDLLDLREDLSKIAVSAGHTDVLNFLINNKIDVNTRYKNGNTLLMEAARKNYFDTAKVLINKGANVGAKNKKGETVLQVVRYKAQVEGFMKTGHMKTPRGWTKMIKLLGNNGADFNEKDSFGQSLLYSAVMDNDVEFVKALLSVADIKNILSMVYSYKNGIPLSNLQIYKLRDSALIDINGKSVHLEGYSFLMCAIDNDNNEIVELLLNHGSDIEQKKKDGDTALGFALYRDVDPKIIQMLLDKGANINARNNEGSTPIMIAAKEGNLETIQMLLDKGADINDRDNEGSTPLMLAVKKGRSEAAIFLIDKGADPFIENEKGETALSLAKRITKERWANFVIKGAKQVIRKIKALDHQLEKQ